MAIFRAGPWGNLSDSYQPVPTNTAAEGLTLYPVNCAKADWPSQAWGAYYEVEDVGNPPTADLAKPLDDGTIDKNTLNVRGYIDVTFVDTGPGIDTATIDGGEFTIGGSAIDTAALSGGAPTLVSGTTYRYSFTGNFKDGTVTVNFVAGSFANLDGTVNLSEIENFTVACDTPAGSALTVSDWGTISGITKNSCTSYSFGDYSQLIEGNIDWDDAAGKWYASWDDFGYGTGTEIYGRYRGGFGPSDPTNPRGSYAGECAIGSDPGCVDPPYSSTLTVS